MWKQRCVDTVTERNGKRKIRWVSEGHEEVGAGAVA